MARLALSRGAAARAFRNNFPCSFPLHGLVFNVYRWRFAMLCAEEVQSNKQMGVVTATAVLFLCFCCSTGATQGRALAAVIYTSERWLRELLLTPVPTPLWPLLLGYCD